MNKFRLCIACFCVILTLSCKNSNNSDILLPQVKGSANDVIIVMTGKYWEGKPGELIRTRFSEPFPSLPQTEPIFDILYTPHDNFDNVYKRQRNIFIVKIGPDYKENLKVHKNLYAKPQAVLFLTAPNEQAFETYFVKIQDKIVQIIQDLERERLIEVYRSSLEKSVYNKIMKKHKIKLTVPVGYEISMDSSGLVWLSNEYKNIHEEILIYYYPYTDTNAFSKEALFAKRNEIGKKYVGGTAEGSYMTTENFYLKYKEFALNGGKYTVEMRGLWKLIGGMSMGGPFVNISQYDEKRQRIVTVEGFIFAPGEDKRNFINKMEAIIYTLEFPDI